MNSARRTLATACIAVVLAGCAIGKPLPTVATYVIEPPPVAELNVQRRPDALRMGRVHVAAAFGGKALVYRRDDVQYVSDPYNEFMAEPGAMLGSQIAAWLDRAGPFGTVVQPESLRAARYLLDATIVELYGDFREGRPPAAVVVVQFTLLDQSGPRPKAVHERTISSRIELPQASPDELVRGYGKALAEILAQLVADFGSTAST